MKKNLFRFFVKTIILIYIISFLSSFFFYVWFKKKDDILFYKKELNKVLNDYISREISLKDTIIDSVILNLKDYNDIKNIKIQTGADFVKVIDDNCNVLLNYSEITGYSILKNDYLGSLLLNAQSPINTFLYLPYDFLNKGLINFSVKKDSLSYVHIYPFVHKGKKRYLFFGYLISEEKKSLFSKGLFFADALYLVTKDETIINLQGIQLPEKFFEKKYLENLDVIDSKDGEYFISQRSLSDIKGSKLGTLVCFKKAPSLIDYFKNVFLVSIGYSILLTLVISLLILTHYRRAKVFLNDLEETLKNFNKGIFKVSINSKKLKEFSQIYNILDRIANNISNYINDLYYEISSKTSEIFEINKALVFLNKCKDVESLIDKSMKFLKTDLGLNTIDIGECNEILKNCNFCKLKKITVRVDDKDYGFCVDFSDNKEESKKEMVDIFQELFAINMSRIINTLKIRDTNLEYVHLSEILMSLLAQKNVNEIFNLILEKAKDICKADASYIGVYDRSTGNIVLKFFMNINTDEFKSLKFNKNQGLGGLVIRERRGIFIQNYFTDHRIDSPFKDIVKKEGIISTIAVPIFYQDEIYGILYVGYRTMKKDITYELSFLQKMSTAAAIAIERENNINELKNKELELRKAYEELVERRKEINELLKGYKDANLELERSNRELVEQYEIVKKSYEELNSLNKAKDLFLGILSHELKTPITIVKGYIETLLSKDFYLDNKVKSALTTALKSVNNLSEKVDDLLDYMRLETKKLKLYFKEISFREIFRDIANELYPFLEERKQKIIIKDSDFKFKGDVKWLKKAFASVINNSIKFSPDGKNIYIDFEVVEREKLIVPYYVKEKPVLSNKYLIISIRDEGVGIPESEINKIFDSFYELGDIRTHSTGKYKFMSKGVGLGLSFTKQIISMHNGIVYAESDGFDVEKCPGTIIKIVLPMDEEKIVEDKKKESILIIDSDYDFSRFLELFLSQKYSVYLFDDGGVGYLKILEIKPKLVMINVSLKNYDGYEVCSIIKEDKNIKDIPVILYGTGPESFDEIRAQKVKANMIFYPIFDTENLLRVVEYYMKR